MPYIEPLPGAPEPVLASRALRADGARIEVALARLAGGLAYRLELLRGERCLLAFTGATGGAHRRTLRGRSGEYAFRSVEQLRYDFEREIAAL